MKNFNKLINLLSAKEKKKAIILLFMILVMAFLDVLGVASILPLMTVLANPELIETNTWISSAYIASGFTSPNDFIFALGVLVFIFLVISLAFKALTSYFQFRFTMIQEFEIGKQLVSGYLLQPYSWFLSRNSAELNKNILSQVGVVINGNMMPTLTLISQCIVAFAILMLLIFIDAKIAIIVGVTLSFAYLLIFKITKNMLKRIGEELVEANHERFSAIGEAFGASKEVKFGGLEKIYISRFSKPAYTYALHQATSQIISQLPKFTLEAIAFGGMLLVMLYLMMESGNFSTALPVISVYAFAGYRLMPALQQIYTSVTQIRFTAPALNALHDDLMSLQAQKILLNQGEVYLKKHIKLSNINYTYPNSTNPTLDDINITIPAQSTVGLVGVTGSGKTTTIDIILGLLQPQKGTLKVDDNLITDENLRSWQGIIGYVPQQIYIADDTIVGNIAFGSDPRDIDLNAVIRASELANLHEFIENELPLKYQTKVGERGVRLSGGQRQRIGIARALYRNPQVLIMDEATSALDNLTEQAVMDAVYRLGDRITVIIIAHRLSTVKICDRIFYLEKGELKAEGTYSELVKIQEGFRSMANKA